MQMQMRGCVQVRGFVQQTLMFTHMLAGWLSFIALGAHSIFVQIWGKQPPDYSDDSKQTHTNIFAIVSEGDFIFAKTKLKKHTFCSMSAGIPYKN